MKTTFRFTVFLTFGVLCFCKAPKISAAQSSDSVRAAQSADDDYNENGSHWLDQDEEDEADFPYRFPTLHAGSRDAVSVRAAQYLLRSRGYKVVIDGVFGAQTKAAVKKFQDTKRSKATSADGVLGEVEWSDLIISLRRGNKKKDAVRALQSLLRARGFSIAIDGNFGNQTQATVRRFQQSRNLEVDGALGYSTWCALLDGRILEVD